MDLWNYVDRTRKEKMEMREKSMFMLFFETIATRNVMDHYSSSAAAALFGLKNRIR